MGQLFMVSPDRLECHLGALSLDELLRSCEERSLSGQISVECDGWPGTILLESGRAIDASYQNRVGTAAVSLMKQLRSGELELYPRDQTRDDDATTTASDLIEISINAVVRHGEDSELSGCIRLGNGAEVAEMHFLVGSLSRIVVVDHGPLASVTELVERFRQAGRPITIGLDEEPEDLEAGWEGPTNVRAKVRTDDTGDVDAPVEEPPAGIPYPVLDDMPTLPWRRPDDATAQVELARFVPVRPWWRRVAVPSAIAVTAALSCLLLGMLL